jgi:RNA-directed DNA polymerase
MEKIPKSQEGWNKIKWATIEIHVRKLQKRIYFASKNGQVKLVRNLQKTLVNSYHAKLLVTRQVTQDNKGKKTAGVDGIKILKAPARLALVSQIGVKGKAKPLRRVWIDKPVKAEKRSLGIPSMADRTNQALFKLALEPEWEAKFEPNSYGFRPGRNCHDAIKQIYLAINKTPKYVLDADIKKCFDRIDHSKLLKKLSFSKGKMHQQVKAWLESGVIDENVFSDTGSGTPQGEVISPLLANIALHGMENMLKGLMNSVQLRTLSGTSMGSRDKQRSLSIIRYADDFVVMHYDKEVILQCKKAIISWLNDIGLELSEEKTRITHTLELSQKETVEFGVITPGFNFLGFRIRQFKSKYCGGKIKGGFKTLIVPSKEKCKSYQEKLGLAIRRSSNVSQEVLIKRLNPIISGWSRYFGKSDAISCKTLQKMDFLLYLKLKRWAKRATKSAAAGFLKYWKHSQGRWEFMTKSGIKLNKHVDYAESIKDYIKVIGNCSPYDGNEIYWATRLGSSAFMSKSQAWLLRKQKGRCNLCKLPFVEEDVMETDHIIPLSNGGAKASHNIQLLHRHCHDQKNQLN